MENFCNARELLTCSANKYGERTAFKIKHKNGKAVAYTDITYKILKEQSERLGSFLMDKGLVGRRIAVIGKNCYEWMLVYLSVLSINSVIVPLDSGLFGEEILEQLERAEADAIFYTEPFEELLKDKNDILKIRMDSDEFSKTASEYSKNADYDNISIDTEKMSILLFTSGTTSRSKAVMLNQRNIISNLHGLNKWEKFYETDVNMALLPFHHTFGAIQVILFLSNGMCNVFCEGLRIAKCLTEYKVTVLVCVPRILEEIQLAVNKKLKKTKKLGMVNKLIRLSNMFRKIGIDVRRKLFSQIIEGLGGGLRLVIVGAAACKPDNQSWFNDIGILTIQGYGLTETSPVISAENPDNMRLGSIGKPLPGVEVKIVDKNEDGIGEIIARGDNVMLGYYKYEGESPVKDGWMYTGDMGYIDNDGFIFITGRKKNVIVLSNGKNVFPEELEALLGECGAIRECIVLNDKKGDKDCIHAKIVYNTDYTAEEADEIINGFIEELNKKLIGYKQIKSCSLQAEELEKTTTLKIKR